MKVENPDVLRVVSAIVSGVDKSTRLWLAEPGDLQLNSALVGRNVPLSTQGPLTKPVSEGVLVATSVNILLLRANTKKPLWFGELAYDGYARQYAKLGLAALNTCTTSEEPVTFEVLLINPTLRELRRYNMLPYITSCLSPIDPISYKEENEDIYYLNYHEAVTSCVDPEEVEDDDF